MSAACQIKMSTIVTVIRVKTSVKNILIRHNMIKLT